MSVEPVTGSATPPASLIGTQSQGLAQTDFLKMLTAELKAQDPLNPMSNSEYASQLAQFSSLQQLQTISDTLNNSYQATLLLGQVFNNTMATSLIGKVVRAQANSVSMSSSGTADLNYALAGNATDITVEISNSDGKVIRTLNVPAQIGGQHSVPWDGQDSNGQHVPEGTYTFAVTAKDANGQAVNVSTYMEGLVSEVRYVNGQVVLMVDGREVALADVLLVRDPTDPSKKG